MRIALFLPLLLAITTSGHVYAQKAPDADDAQPTQQAARVGATSPAPTVNQGRPASARPDATSTAPAPLPQVLTHGRPETAEPASASSGASPASAPSGALNQGRTSIPDGAAATDAAPVMRTKALAAGSVRLSHMGPDGDASYDGLQPDVAFNPTDDEYFVVWAGTDDAGSLHPSETEIYGVRVSGSTGSTVGSVVRLSQMGSDGDPTFSAQHPAVAYDASQGTYLVVWQGTASAHEYELYGRTVDAQDLSLGTTTRLTRMGTDGDPAVDALAPALTQNPAAGEFYLVWHGSAGGEVEVYGRRLGPGGSPLGSGPSALSSAGPAGDSAWRAAHPAVTHDPSSNTYFVVWSGSDDAAGLAAGEHEIFLQRVDASGAEIGTDDQRVSQIGSDGDASLGAMRPALRADGSEGEVLVTWSSNVPDGHGAYEVYAQRLDASTGAEVGSDDFRLSTMGPDGAIPYSAFEAAVAVIPGREYMVVWRGDDGTDGAFEVYRQQVYADRTTGDQGGDDDALLSGLSTGTPGIGAARPAIAAGSNNSYLAVWSGDTTMDTFVAGEYEIFASLVTPSQTLPVELTDFHGRLSDGDVTLQWTTASEVNNAGFEVQRAEGDGWKTLGFVPGSGTTAQTERYRFRDGELPYAAEALRYRLRQVDADGTAHLTSEISVERAPVLRLELLGTFPNPARTVTTVRFAVPEQSADAVTLELYDLLGRRVRSVVGRAAQGRTELQLDVSGLAPGPYFLRLQADGQARTQKLTVTQ